MSFKFNPFTGKPDFVGTSSAGGESDIVESGSNANGEYVRFSDGTQICWGLIPIPATNSSGEVHRSEPGYWDFPVQFSEAPHVFASGSQVRWFSSEAQKDNPTVQGWGRQYSRRSRGAFSATAFAIGRWQ